MKRKSTSKDLVMMILVFFLVLGVGTAGSVALYSFFSGHSSSYEDKLGKTIGNNIESFSSAYIINGEGGPVNAFTQKESELIGKTVTKELAPVLATTSATDVNTIASAAAQAAKSGIDSSGVSMNQEEYEAFMSAVEALTNADVYKAISTRGLTSTEDLDKIREGIESRFAVMDTTMESQRTTLLDSISAVESVVESVKAVTGSGNEQVIQEILVKVSEDKNMIQELQSQIETQNANAKVLQQNIQTLTSLMDEDDQDISAICDAVSQKLAEDTLSTNKELSTRIESAQEHISELKVLLFQETKNAEQATKSLTDSLSTLEGSLTQFKENTATLQEQLQKQLQEEEEARKTLDTEMSDKISAAKESLQEKIDEQQALIESNKETFDLSIGRIASDLSDNTDLLNEKIVALGNATASKEALEQAQTTLQQALSAEENEREQALEQAKTTLNEAIAAAGDNASSELVNAKNALEELIEAEKTARDAAVSESSTEAQEALEKAVSDTNEAIDNLNTSLSTDIEQANESITTINGQIGDLSNTVTSLVSYDAVLLSKIDDVNEQIQNNYDELVAATATKTELQSTKEALEQANTSLQGAITAEESNREQALEQAKTTLNEAIAAAGDNASAELVKAKDDLEKLIEAEKTARDAAVSESSTEAQEALEKAVSDTNEVIEAAKTSLGGDITRANDSITGINQTIQNLNTDITSLTADNETNKQDIAKLKSDTTNNSDKISELNSKNTELSNNLDAAKSSISDLEAATNVDDANTAIAKAIAAAESSANTSAADNLKTTKEALEKAYADGDEAAIEAAKENAKEEIDKLNSTLSSKIASNETQITSLSNDITQMQTQIDGKASQKDLSDLKTEIDNRPAVTYTFSTPAPGSQKGTTLTVVVPTS